jgi:hydrogenase expression/formation protein HypC
MRGRARSPAVSFDDTAKAYGCGKSGVAIMCLALPGRITNIQDGYAQVDYGGVSKQASVRLFKDAKVGDRVLVHAGFIIQILDKDDGDELEKLIEETMGFTNADKI